MDKNTVLIIVISIFALIILAAILRFRQGVKAHVRGPFDTSLELDASNPQPTPGATIKGAKSHAGGIRAEDTLRRGAHIEDAEAHGDIVAITRATEEKPDPKA
jgi:hypothetical protein